MSAREPAGARYQAVRWSEPIVTELGAPGQRGLAKPQLDAAVAGELEAALEAIPSALRRATAPALPEIAQNLVVRHFLRLSQMSQGAHLVADTLGTCTMKYSPLVGELIARSPKLLELHPDQPEETVQGLLEIVWRMEQLLRAVSGFDAFSFQGGGGSQGIYTSALIIRAWHESRGDGGTRNEIIYCPGVPTKVMGTAGAGDAFASTFASRIAMGETPADALRAATLNAASVLAHVDTQTGLLDRAALEAQLAERVGELDVRRWPLATP